MTIQPELMKKRDLIKILSWLRWNLKWWSLFKIHLDNFFLQSNKMDLKGGLSGILSQDSQESIVRQGVLCKWITGQIFLRETNEGKGEAEYRGERSQVTV